MHTDARPGRKPAQHLKYAGVIMADIMVSHGVGCRRGLGGINHQAEAGRGARCEVGVLVCMCFCRGRGRCLSWLAGLPVPDCTHSQVCQVLLIEVLRPQKRIDAPIQQRLADMRGCCRRSIRHRGQRQWTSGGPSHGCIECLCWCQGPVRSTLLMDTLLDPNPKLPIHKLKLRLTFLWPSPLNRPTPPPWGPPPCPCRSASPLLEPRLSVSWHPLWTRWHGSTTYGEATCLTTQV